MSRWINTDQLFLPHVAKAMEVAVTNNAQVVAEFDYMEPIAAVIFDGYNGHSVNVHIWIHPERRPSRMFFYAVYHYCFEQLRCQTVIGTVPGKNRKAQKLDEHLGFRVKATVENYYPDGDSMLLYVATPDTIPDWRKWSPVQFAIAA